MREILYILMLLFAAMWLEAKLRLFKKVKEQEKDIQSLREDLSAKNKELRKLKEDKSKDVNIENLAIKKHMAFCKKHNLDINMVDDNDIVIVYRREKGLNIEDATEICQGGYSRSKPTVMGGECHGRDVFMIKSPFNSIDTLD